ncbi:hypothetical protein [Parerythrobacter jejuensis]|uniref:Uncharacterized protein n=1 Tax=Parerythrobacter jejuensis TaxID=795812 RepID=A0A845AP28_9SPHN|nr:hypothetical protein [Parerythrobacter jejuensis]MXP30256.1 hypothetical protein [Parerythrobacter jejuensis]MXP33016.1 hypothetical protein [Parerythrobacter jejuensis]
MIDGLSCEARAILDRARAREEVLNRLSVEIGKLLEAHEIPFERIFCSATYDDKLAVLIFFSSVLPYSDTRKSAIGELTSPTLMEYQDTLGLDGSQVEFSNDLIVKNRYGGDYDRWYVDN